MSLVIDWLSKYVSESDANIVNDAIGRHDGSNVKLTTEITDSANWLTPVVMPVTGISCHESNQKTQPNMKLIADVKRDEVFD
jgi:hypothetical protein